MGEGAGSDEPDPSREVRAPASLRRVLFSAGLGAAALYVLFGLVIVAPIMAYDGYWHLLVGQEIAARGLVPREDFFCFTAAGLDWINLNWLAQLIAHRLYRAGGFDGPLLLSGVLFTVALAASLLNASRRGALALLTLTAGAFCFFAVWLPYGIRPRMWSFALIAVFAALLGPGGAPPGLGWRLGRAGILLALLWLWNNLHGGFVYGYGLIGFAWLGERLDVLRREGWREATWRLEGWILPGTILAGFGGFVAHPHGLAALHHALVYPRRFHPEIWPMVAELQPYAFEGTLGAFLILYLLLAALGVGLERRAVRLADLVPVVIFLVFTLRVRRGLTPFLLISAPFVAELWSAALRRWLSPKLLGNLEQLQPAVRRLPLILLLGVSAYVPSEAASFRPGQPGALEGAPAYRDQLTVDAVQAIRDGPLPGRVFVQYELGGFVAWGLQPSRRVFIDGRMDLHCRGQAWVDYLTIVRLEPGWEERLDAHQIDVVLLRRGEPLLDVLFQQRGWRLGHLGPGFVLLTRPALQPEGR